MSNKMLRAWIFGALIAGISQGLWFASILASDYSELLFVLLSISPFAAALVVAHQAPRKKMQLGMSMALVVAVLTVLANTVFQFLGTAVDFPEARGGWILFVITLTYSAVAAALGGAAGQWLTRRRVS